MSRFAEFFEDDETRRRSMNRLSTFVATMALAACLMYATINESEMAEMFAIALAGLGGFNYGAAQFRSGYAQVRIAQAEQGIQPQAPPSSAPVLNINTGTNTQPVNIPDAKNVNVDSQGDVNINRKDPDDGIKRTDN